MQKGSTRYSLVRLFSLVILTVLTTLTFSFSAQAQTSPDEAPVETETVSESVQASSTVKFRGFKNAMEDLPFMSEDWKVSFFQLASVEADRLDDNNTASWFFYNYFSFNYRLSDDERLAIRPVFRMESPGKNSYDEEISKWDFTWDDWYVSYSKFNLFEIGPFGTRANVRLYIPTSEHSKDNGLITRLHPEFFMETSLGRNLGVEFQFKGDYYFNSKRAYILKTQDGDQIRLTNKEAEFESIAELKYRAHRMFHIKPRVSWHDEWNLSSPENRLRSRHTQEFTAAVGVEIRPTENFNTTIQFGNATQVYNNKPNWKRPKLWLPENNEIVALTNYRF